MPTFIKATGKWDGRRNRPTLVNVSEAGVISTITHSEFLARGGFYFTIKVFRLRQNAAALEGGLQAIFQHLGLPNRCWRYSAKGWKFDSRDRPNIVFIATIPLDKAIATSWHINYSDARQTLLRDYYTRLDKEQTTALDLAFEIEVIDNDMEVDIDYDEWMINVGIPLVVSQRNASGDIYFLVQEC